jgi:AAA15 family ATPase/GTPase
MLSALHIQNYRLFSDFVLADLAQVNLIAGKNNTGKSTLLEAIRIPLLQTSRQIYYLHLTRKKA